MAHMMKIKSDGCYGALAHSERELPSYSNPDIDLERSELNWDLTPEHEGFEFSNYKSNLEAKLDYLEYLKENNSIYNNRKDITIMNEFTVTLPREIYSMTDNLNKGIHYPEDPTIEKNIHDFFQTTVDFFSERYGRDNIVSAIVHFDEGKKIPVISRNEFGQVMYQMDQNLDYVLDENGKKIPEYERDLDGNIQYKYHSGNIHLHIDIAPIMRRGDTYFGKYDRETRTYKNEEFEVKIPDGYNGKFDSNRLFNPHEMRRYHKDLQQYLIDHGVSGKVLNGATAGGNRTVAELKADTDKNLGLEIEREKERGINL